MKITKKKIFQFPAADHPKMAIRRWMRWSAWHHLRVTHHPPHAPAWIMWLDHKIAPRTHQMHNLRRAYSTVYKRSRSADIDVLCKWTLTLSRGRKINQQVQKLFANQTMFSMNTIVTKTWNNKGLREWYASSIDKNRDKEMEVAPRCTLLPLLTWFSASSLQCHLMCIY